MSTLRLAAGATIACALVSTMAAPTWGAAPTGRPAAARDHLTRSADNLAHATATSDGRDKKAPGKKGAGKKAHSGKGGRSGKDTKSEDPTPAPPVPKPPVRGVAEISVTEPEGITPAVTVEGPHRYERVVRTTRRLHGLRPGRYTVTPQRVVRWGGVVHADVTVPAFRVSRAQQTVATTVAYTFVPTPGDVTPPGALSNLVATPGPRWTQLSWQNPGDLDLAAIVVRRAEGDQPPARSDDGVAVDVTPDFGTAAIDRGLKPDTTYAYTLFARDSNGNVGAPVSAVVHTPHYQIYAAGDIGWCGGAMADTAALIPTGADFLALGDIAYFSGTREEYRKCYAPHYGRLLPTTWPTPGNHEYRSHTDGYRDYFGDRLGGTRKAPWYTVRFGNWLILMLDSNCQPRGGCGVGSDQYEWVKQTLAAQPSQCLAAAWHHPRWGTGEEEGTGKPMDRIYRLLDDAGADFLLTGHLHRYERFSRTGPDGRASVDGIRQFVVGTGGAPLLKYDESLPTLERSLRVHGVLRMNLEPDAFTWEFVDTTGTSIDAGHEVCDPS